MVRIRLSRRVTIGWQGRRWLPRYTHECPCHRVLEIAGVYVLVKS